MRCTTRFFAALAAVALMGYTSAAQADLYTTVGAPASSLTLEIWFGPPGGQLPTDPPVDSVLTATIGPLAVTGTASATVDVDGLGDGTLAFGSANLLVEDIADQYVDIVTGVPDGGLLTTYVDLSGVGLDINSSDIPVLGNLWDLDGIGAGVAGPVAESRLPRPA